MKYLVGLGNPGDKYKNTRHNVGFMILDKLAKDLNVGEFNFQKKANAEVVKTSVPANQVLLIKPQTFMNKSGQAVRSVLDFYKDSGQELEACLPNLYVVHDDLDLELGKFKVQLATGPKIHNGLNSLYQHLGSNNFWHVRVGIDTRLGDRTVPGQSYVLQNFSDQEQEQLAQAIELVSSELLHLVNQQIG